MIGVNRLVTAIGDMQAAVPALPMVAAGLSWLAGTLPLVAAGIVAEGHARLIGLGRTSIAYPQMVNDLRRTGAIAAKACCVACAQCSQLMKNGNRSGCVVREPAVYGAERRRGPQKWLGAFLCSQPGNIDRVYGNGRRARLESLLPMRPDVVTADDLTAHPERLNPIRYLFSTWGMPALNAGQIDALFPRLEAVFYAAGSVRHFAAPFIGKGIHVISGFRANAVPVAEYTVAQVLLAAKGAFAMRRAYAESRGCPRETGQQPSYPGNYGLTVSLLGAGAIGSLVIELLKPFNITVLVFDPFLKDERAAALNVTKVSIEDAFARGMVVSNHLANLPETQRMIRGEHVASMLPGTTFINTGRGATIDEPAMIDVLRNRPDITAVLDVTCPEPPQPHSPLWTLPNVFLTPHIAGSMGQEVWRMADYVIDDFLRYTSGEALRHEVTASMLATMA